MLRIENVSKTFPGVKAVDDVSFSVSPGEIMGLIGQNGAGKSTLFRMILNLLKKDEGEILWNDHPIRDRDLDRIGFLPEERGLYPKRTIENQIIFFAELRGQSPKVTKSKIDEWWEKLEVKGKKTDKVKTLSKGNQQKIQLICTLIHEPDLIILDEPFTGLDPVNASLLAKSIIEAKERGACVIFSSHNMENVTEICDRLLMLRNGKTILNGTLKEVREEFPKDRLFVQSDSYSLEDLLKLEGVISGETTPSGIHKLILEDEKYGYGIFDLLSKEGYIQTFSQQSPDLDEIFRIKAGAKDE